jgi:hypothetical protein
LAREVKNVLTREQKDIVDAFQKENKLYISSSLAWEWFSQNLPQSSIDGSELVLVHVVCQIKTPF